MLLRQTILYLPAQLIGPLALFISAVLWTHYFTASEYGVLMLVFAFQELASMLALSWWSLYTQRFAGSLLNEPSRAAYQRTERFVLIASAAAQAAGIAAALVLSGLEQAGVLVASAIAYTVTRTALTHFGERARAMGFIGAYTLSQSSGPVLGFAFGHIAILTWGAFAAHALAGFALAQALALAAVWSMLRVGFAGARPDRAVLSEALRYSGPLIISGGMGWFSANGIRPVVERLADTAAVGLLSVGWGLGQRLMSVAAMLVTAAAFPLAVKRLNGGTIEDSLAQISRSGALLAAVLLPAAAGLIAVTPFFIPLIVAEPFRGATLQILPLAAAAAAVRNMRVHFADQAFLITRDTDSVVWFNGFEAVMTGGFCIAGYFHAGLPGAAAGCLAGAAVSAVHVFTWARVKHRLVIPWAHFARIAAAVLAMLAALKSAAWAVSFSSLAAQVALGGAVYAVTLAALNAGELRRLLQRPRPGPAAA